MGMGGWIGRGMSFRISMVIASQQRVRRQLEGLDQGSPGLDLMVTESWMDFFAWRGAQVKLQRAHSFVIVIASVVFCW